MANIIYTLGTSKRKIEEFLAILKFYKIKQVVDVRRWPTSKWFEHFKKENLKEILKKNKIQYCHLEKLGGYRTGGYQAYTKKKEFKEGLKDLIKISKKRKTVFICAEKLPWRCHRAFISQKLERLGYQIIHIIERERIWQPKKEKREIREKCAF